MTHAERRKHIDSRIIKLILVSLFCQVLLAGYIYADSYKGRDRVVKTQRAACERNKLDREANALGWTGASIYILKVTKAKSVKEDVKKAAREVSKIYQSSAADLISRTGPTFDCTIIFPPVGFWPWNY